jgi:hypothetical protein
VITQWLASIALVVANAEMRFLWLSHAKAILVATELVIRRKQQTEKALRETTPQDLVGGSTPLGDRHD